MRGVWLGIREGWQLLMDKDNWDEMRCPECDAWFYPEKNTRRWCEKCNDKELLEEESK